MSIFADVRCVVITDNASRFLYSRFYGKDGETPEFCEHFKRTIVSKAKKSTTERLCPFLPLTQPIASTLMTCL